MVRIPLECIPKITDYTTQRLWHTQDAIGAALVFRSQDAFGYVRNLSLLRD